MPDALRRQLKLTRPFESLEQEAFLNLARTAGELLHEATVLLKQSKLSVPQYNALRILRGAGPSGLPCKEIAERMVNRVPDVTRLLDRLESAGYIRRCREGRDRRVVTTTITEAGKTLVNGLDEPMHRLHRRQLQSLGDEKLATLIRLLEEVRATRDA